MLRTPVNDGENHRTASAVVNPAVRNLRAHAADDLLILDRDLAARRGLHSDANQ
jgi:hypothetical protein